MKYLYALLTALVLWAGVYAQADTWVTVNMNNVASMAFPAQPRQTSVIGQTAFTLNANNHIFTTVLGSQDVGTNLDEAALQQYYKNYLEGTLKVLPGTEVLDQKDFTSNGATGKEYLLHAKGQTVNIFLCCRAIIINGKEYSFIFGTYNAQEQASADKERFFNSFKLGVAPGALKPVPVATPPLLDYEKYVPQVEIFFAITAGVFAFILLAVFVQYLVKRLRTKKVPPPVG